MNKLDNSTSPIRGSLVTEKIIRLIISQKSYVKHNKI